MPVPLAVKNCIQLAACAANQLLPMNPELPADLFTSCLTTPIKVALRWFCSQNSSKIVPGMTLELIEKHAWDLAVDLCLLQLPEVIENPANFKVSSYYTVL
ncbi:predicted protein [Nematostella vectensis]|uniref:Uncharacterized protein n=1 Tax=Nematostella vectensis TaxID=45351 RepID=A7TCT4_NEMVE|nr:predicted protein [Nematostella vectensis]|eukprot:XP_001618230.1 hypothetical protein NEMVEDRAFT_v1g225368 [Nematostella vectensis]